jgi:hypothetical protein
MQVARQPGSIGPGALDPDEFDRPEAPDPGEGLSIAGEIRGKRLAAELGAPFVEHRHHVHVTVGVDPGRDASRRLCHCGHSHPLVVGWPHRPGRRTGQGWGL